MSQHRLEVPVANGVKQTVSEDLRHVALIFRTKRGPLPVAIPAANVGHVIASLVEAAQQVGGQPASVPEGQQNGAPRIAVSGISVADGRTEGEALLAVSAGPLTLNFAVESAALKNALKQLDPKKSAKRKR